VGIDGKPQYNIDTSGTENLTRGIDSSGIQRGLKVPPEQLYAAMQNAQKAAYGMQTQYLDPQYQSQQKDLENKLTQQGVLQNSDAWNRAMDEMGRQKTFDYNNAFNNSFSTGLAANNQLFNQDLSSGQFVNQAQAQQFGEGMANANLNNSAANQLYNQRMGQANLNNSTADTEFRDKLANAQFGNQAHAQQLSDMLQEQQNPINMMNALRTGTQINTPNFGSGGYSPTDMSAQYQNVYNGQLAGYNTKVAQNNAMTQGLFELGAAALSDRRAKENIVSIGRRPDGLGIYEFEYRPAFKDMAGHGKFIGVMADEVEKLYPKAVMLHPTGFKMVNYAAI